MKIQDLRRNYDKDSLNVADLQADPFKQFEIWFNEALKQGGIREANAMTLATASPEGQPSARIVLLKGFDQRGFAFYTNYNSRKGQELTANPKAALVFFWPSLERQVRIEGIVEKMSQEESTNYFESRPKKSQIGATASPQSSVIPNRELLEENVRKLEATYKDAETLPCPKHWGGFRLLPHAVEFWQGRPSRLHDRLRYQKEAGKWELERLAP